MSFLNKLFGGGKSGSKTPTPAEAIQRLREVEEMLNKKQDFLERSVQQELENAKRYGKKNQRAAFQALRKKKRYEKQLQQLDGTLTQIEYQREALEKAHSNTEVIKVMGFAAKALKGAHEMDVDKVHDLMDEVAEQQEISNEISEAISNPIAFDRDFDDDELAKELDELEQEELDIELIKVGPVPQDLPNVPTSVPSRPEKPAEEEDDDMKELAAWAS